MANWILNTGRKDLTEQQVFTKGDSTIKYSTGWRSGTWFVTTSDDNEPDFEADENGMVELGWANGSNIEECSFEESFDGCWDEWEFSDDISEEERERIMEGWEEDAYEFLYQEDWMEDDTYWYASKDSLEFERVDD